jgi:hypothetical protein
MRRILALLALPAFAACASAHAQGGRDLMNTPECRAARQQLDELLAAGGPKDRVPAARRQTALRCFGQEPAPPPEGRFVPAPVAVDPIRLRASPVLPPAAAPVAVPTPPLAIPRPPVLTTCDSAGCWDSNGARYNQQGPVLLGPRGACVAQGGALNCP